MVTIGRDRYTTGMALKVYRTPIGFHDAYVAAASQKAALAAWGTTKNLFARGDAEIVDDETLTAEPLANPGKVIKRSRGTTAEHVAALPEEVPKSASKTPGPARKPPPPKPRPSRRSLDTAETALAALADRHAQEMADIERRIAELEREREALNATHDRERVASEKTRDAAKARYEAAIGDWQG